MQKGVDGQWECMFCGRQSKVKTNILEHIEASHMETPGYSCEICNKDCRTRNALRAHKHRSHNPTNTGYTLDQFWFAWKLNVMKGMLHWVSFFRVWFYKDQWRYIYVQLCPTREAIMPHQRSIEKAHIQKPWEMILFCFNKYCIKYFQATSLSIWWFTPRFWPSVKMNTAALNVAMYAKPSKTYPVT